MWLRAGSRFSCLISLSLSLSFTPLTPRGSCYCCSLVVQENRIIFGHPLVYPRGRRAPCFLKQLMWQTFLEDTICSRGLWQTMANLHGATRFSHSLRSHFCLVFMPLVKASDKHKACWLHFKDRERENAWAWQNNRGIYRFVDNQPHNAGRTPSVLLWLSWNHRSWTVNNGLFDHSSTRTGSQNTTRHSELILKLSNLSTTSGKHNFGSAWYQNVNQLF